MTSLERFHLLLQANRAMARLEESTLSIDRKKVTDLATLAALLEDWTNVFFIRPLELKARREDKEAPPEPGDQPAAEPETKRCTRCDRRKPLDEFAVATHLDPAGRTRGRASQCKACQRETYHKLQAKRKAEAEARPAPPEERAGPVEPLPETKKCTKCGVPKPLEEFPRSRKYKDGRAGACEACCREYWRRHSAEMRAKPAAAEPRLPEPACYIDQFAALWYVDLANPSDRVPRYIAWRRHPGGVEDAMDSIVDVRDKTDRAAVQMRFERFAATQLRWRRATADEMPEGGGRVSETEPESQEQETQSAEEEAQPAGEAEAESEAGDEGQED